LSVALRFLSVDDSEGDEAVNPSGSWSQHSFRKGSFMWRKNGVLTMDARLFPEGQQVETRDVIENVLAAALESEQSGRVLGGAFGTQFAYLDLMLFNGQDSVRSSSASFANRTCPPERPSIFSPGKWRHQKRYSVRLIRGSVEIAIRCPHVLNQTSKALHELAVSY